MKDALENVEELYEILSSEHDTVAVHMNSLKLELPAQGQANQINQYSDRWQ